MAAKKTARDKKKESTETAAVDAASAPAPVVTPTPTLATINAASPVITSSGILPLFWSLAAIDAAERLQAASQLITILTRSQEAFKAATPDWDVLSQAKVLTDEQLMQLCSSEVGYSIKRLVRGLPSSREGARQGFSLALTELLAQLPFATSVVILQLIKQYTEITGGMKAQEERDMYFGRIFGILALDRAGVLRRPSTSAQDFTVVATSLIEIAYRKSYLQEMSSEALGSILHSLVEHDFAPEVIDNILEQFSLKEDSPDKLALLLKIQELFPKADLSRALPTWDTPPLLHPTSLHQVAEILKDSTLSNPRVHCVWVHILKRYTPIAAPAQPAKTKTPKKNNSAKQVQELPVIAPLDAFWRIVVDDALFSSTIERRYLGFRLMERFVETVAADMVPFLLTQNFLRSLINNLHRPDNNLNKVARRALDALTKRAQNSPTLAVHVVAQLTGPNGTAEFDRLSRTNTISVLITSLDSTSLQTHVKNLCAVVLEPDTNDHVANDANDNQDGEDDAGSQANQSDRRRQWAVDAILAVIRNPRVQRDPSWIVPVLAFLIRHAFFERVPKVTDKQAKAAATKAGLSDVVTAQLLASPSTPVSPFLRAILRQRFMSALTDLSKQRPKTKTPNEEDGSKHDDEENSAEQWAEVAAEIVQQYESTGAVAFVEPFSDEHDALRKKLWSTQKAILQKTQELEAVNADEINKHLLEQQRAFRMLLINIYLQMLDAREVVETGAADLFSCYERLSQQPSKKLSHSKSEEDNEKLEPISVLVDTLLSFLAQPSQLLRSVVEHAFRAFCVDLTPTALGLLTEILEIGGTEAETSSLMDVDGEAKTGGEEEEEEEEEVEEDHVGPEHHDHNHNHIKDTDETEQDVQEDEDEEDEDEEDDDELDDDDDGEVDEDFRQKIKAALERQGMSATKGAKEITDQDELEGEAAEEEEDDEEEEEELLDDDAMMAFDAKLSEIFRLRKLEKAKKSEAKKNLQNLKFKVFDLLEIFVRRGSSKPLVLTMLPSLVKIALVSPDQQVVQRIGNIINRVKSSKSLPSLNDVGAEQLRDLFDQLHELLCKASAQAAATTAASACAVVIRIIQSHANSENITPITPTKSAKKKKQEPKLDLVQHVQQAYVAATTKLLGEKHSHIHPVVLQDYIKRYAAWGKQLVQPLTEYIGGSNVRSFQLLIAVDLLSLLIQNNQNIEEFAMPLQQSIAHFLSSLPVESDTATEKKTFKSKHIKDILQVLHLLVRRLQKTSKEAIHVSELVDALQHLQRHPVYGTTSSVRNLSGQLIQTLQKLNPSTTSVQSTPAPDATSAKKNKASTKAESPKKKQPRTKN